MTLSVATSSSIAVSATLATSTDADTQTFDSFATEQSLSYASELDSSGLAMVLGGEATAIGEDTLAAATMTAEVDSTGLVTTAQGSATFAAVAVSPTDATTFATANSFGGLSGADVMLVLTSNTQIVSQGPDESIAIATSETMLYGADFGPIGSGVSVESDPMPAPAADSELLQIANPATDDQEYVSLFDDFSDAAEVDIDGNVAILDIVAQVLGPDTLLEVDSSVLTVEDTLSTISAEIIAAIA